MWEAFKILLLCLFSIVIASLTDSWLFISAVFLVLVVFLYDFDLSTGLERHATSKLNNWYLKVRNLYSVIFQREQDISFQYTPTMNSVNKQTSSFDLSRFNKSGNALSPISNSANSGTFTSRRLIQPRQTSTPLTRTSPWQQNSASPANNARSSAFHSSITNRSPRYSLSSLTPKTVSSESPIKPTIQTVTGPLLASTRFNVNLGTYTDTKSPGLASRVVQYHNELSGSQSSTHQSRYGSPGQFPIVQLYKKELPILGRSARRCTVRIAPPDPVSYNSDHANTILRDSFVQNNNEAGANLQNDTEINTRSVLEALKEISRKRIHTDDDIDDISKRQRKNSVSSTNSSMHLNKDGKRMREDTPPKPKESSTTPVNSAPKRICVVNEIESSLSSSRLMRLHQGQKRKSTLNIPETNKQRRVTNGVLVSRETQTTITNGSKSTAPENSKDSQKTTSTAAQTESESGSGLANGMLDIQQILDSTRRKKKSTEIRSTRDIDEENSTLQFAKGSTVPTKSIFSEAPLEIMKQNKLSVMLSALAGREPEIIPLPDMTLSALKKKSEDHPDGTDIINKEVVSILSPKNKPKHDKHVTFAIPNSNPTETNATSNSGASNVSVAGTNIAFSVPATALNFASPSFAASSFSNSFSTVTSGACGSSPSSLQTLNPPAFSVSNGGSSLAPTSTPVRPNPMFGSVAPPPNNSITTTTNSTNIITSSAVDRSENSPNKNTINFGSAAPSFNFGSNNSIKPQPPAFGGPVPSSQSTAVAKIDDTNKTSAATSAGFQFSSPSAAPTSSVMFGSPAPTSLTFTPTSPQQQILGFGAKPVQNQQTTSSFAPTNASFTTSAPASSASSPGMFSLVPKTDAKTPPPFSFGGAPAAGLPAAASQPKTGGFKFDLGKSVATPSPVSKAAVGPSTLNKSGTFSFGATPTKTTAPPAFGAQNTTTIVPSFGVPNKTIAAGMFGSPANSGGFGAPNTTAAVFGVPSTTAATGVFGAPSTTAATGVFGTPSTTATPGVFGAPSTTAAPGVFGVPSTTAATGVFGAPSTTAAPGVFGTPSTTAATGVFGAPSTTAAPGVFGAPSTTTASGVFGATTAASAVFGAATTTTAGAFGTTNAAPNTGIFGTASAPAFGAPKTTENPPSFGAFAGSGQNAGFGTAPQQNSNTFAQSNAFSSSTPATTTSSFSFGSNSTKPFAFGTNTVTTSAPTMFGSTNTTTPSNVFGGTASSGFGNTTGASSTFGGTATTTAQSSFGQQQQQQSSSGVFGTATASSNFGTGTSGSTFGTNNNNTFGSSTAPNVFGTQQASSTFGSGTPNQGNVFGGSSNNNNQSSSSVFGTTTANNNNTFGQNSTAAFGSGSAASSFGSPAAPTGQVFTFGGVPAPSTSATPSTSNAFQFGGQTPKQSGFNFSANANANTHTPNISFGAGAPPAFNASPAPAFGSPAPAGGMFNIGSGSTAPKQRPMIKARRRN